MLPFYTPVRVTADKKVKGGKCVLHSFTINSVTTGGTLSIYDAITETGTALGAFVLVTIAAGTQIPQVIGPLDWRFKTGCYFGYDATLAADITAAIG